MQARFPVVSLVFTITAAVALLPGCQNPQRGAGTGTAATSERPIPMADTVRAVWVARMHYKTPDDIRTIMRNAAALGFNTVIWQVRGNGTVLYPSRIEPWAREYDHQDPGFDPLAIAIEEAHRNRLRLEAWINVMPGWRGPKPPTPRNQLWYTHPDWFLLDAEGKRQPLGDFYVILNPCHPAVRDYIAGVVAEIAGRYRVDGIHLDYVRYAWETTPNARRLYARDARTVRAYQRETGKRPDDDAKAWDDWRGNQLSRLVGQIRETVDRVRPGAAVTAATWSSPSRGYREYLQNAVGWLRAGLIDAVYPMAYTDDVAALQRYIGEYQQAAPNRRVIPGIGIYKLGTQQQVTEQLARCRSWGGDYAIFSYASLHAVAGDRGRKRSPALDKENQAREVRRSAIGASNGRRANE
jgi:uncharacterized lipoprotein YddW (UPF0748 family)